MSAAPRPTATARRRRLGDILVERGAVRPDTLMRALHRQRFGLSALGKILMRQGLLDETTLFEALAEQRGTRLLRPSEVRPDLAAIDRLGPDICLARRLLPIGRHGAVSVVATSRPAAFKCAREGLEAVLGPVLMAVMTDSDLRAVIERHRGGTLAKLAETRVEAGLSSRGFAGIHPAWVALALIPILSAFVMAPVTAFLSLLALGLLSLYANTFLYAAALVRDPAHTARVPNHNAAVLARLPVVSLLLPLFEETDIAGKLVGHIAALDYPRELLDVILVTEACDRVTADALARAELPPWMRVVRVPDGAVRTKPRAMNYALDHCEGAIVGVYDAEDHPAPDQIRRVVERFSQAPPDVACLQGRLNFYNARRNAITRCFSIDYGAWFGLVLPALARLGWPIPLGGTTVFFRRAALEEVGRWDAHNVTEDADLGIRLARLGHRTALLDSVTLEEATPDVRKWVRQRSRWQKGYAITWIVHMRSPLALWRALGPWRFLGVQVLFVSGLGGALVAPLYWSFLSLWAGGPHPLADVLSPAQSHLLMVALFVPWLISMAAFLAGLARLGRLAMWPWTFLMPLYHMMLTASLLKALYEVATCPFYWDKTTHGDGRADEGSGAGVKAKTRLEGAADVLR